MGVHSTMSVSREVALRKLQGLDWKKLSNEQLENVLDALLYNTLHNFAVDRFGDEDDANLEGLEP